MSVRGRIRKNLNLTLIRDSAKIKYINGGQLSSNELTFRVELVLNSHSNTSFFLH